MTEQATETAARSEVRDGMRIDWDVPIEMDDGVILRADVYRPDDNERHPVILTSGPYAKGLAFQEGFPQQWESMATKHPDVPAGSTNKYQAWEVVDPEKWVPDGYACVRIDSRGAGRSPGVIELWSPRETKDFYDCIEWAGVQPWSNGKVGLNGISYYAMNQWQVASLQPPHLAAICPWEGAADFYRDDTHHGGILTMWWGLWFKHQVLSVQNGVGERGPRNPNTGELTAGPVTLTPEELEKNRVEISGDYKNHPLDDQYHRDRSPAWERITVPLLSSANWGGQGLHARGNFEGFVRSASPQKWLEVHGIEHWTHFYTDYGVSIQKRFFNHFLKGENNGWEEQSRVILNVRHPGEQFVLREENEWPIARTQWTKFYLNPDGMRLEREPVRKEGQVSFEALGEGATFWTEPLEEVVEITGPIAARLWVSSSTNDADLFLVVRVFDPDGKEVLFQGALDPNAPIAQGWLRASHRKLDRQLSTEYRPYHTHDELQPLAPGHVYALDVEVWPTSIVVAPGYRIALSVLGRDYEYDGPGIDFHYFGLFKGCGPFTHEDPDDRPAGVFGGTTTLHVGEDRPSYVLLPVIPNAD